MLTNFLVVLDVWTDAIDSGIPVDALYLDFGKPFDTVPQQRLIRKLDGYGICGNVLAWISNFLKYRRQQVVVNGKRSDWASVTSGIPQGSVLGLIQFVVFINNLPEVTESLTEMFADNTKVFIPLLQQEDMETSERLGQSLRLVRKMAITFYCNEV